MSPGCLETASLRNKVLLRPELHLNQPTAPTLVLGLGNDILTDDGIGLRVVRQLQGQFQGNPLVDVKETSEMGLALLDFLVGYSKVFLVDSIRTGSSPPGFVHQLDAGTLASLTGRPPHTLGVGETLALGQQLGLPMPAQTRCFAIEVQDTHTLSEQMTPALETALPGIVAQIGRALEQL